MNLVAQFHLVELMRDLGSLAVLYIGFFCVSRSSLFADSFGSTFPAREQKEVVDRVTASIPLSIYTFLRKLYISVSCIYKAAIYLAAANTLSERFVCLPTYVW